MPMTSSATPDSTSRFWQRPLVWSFTTYFTEGFPYTLIRTVSSVFFRDRGMSLEGIGMTSLFGLPWILKFLWGPHVDAYASKRGWLLASQGLLCAVFLATALIIPWPSSPPILMGLFFLASFIAATHDIAIDGYYMTALDQDGQARFVGYRAMAYRIAMMTGTGVITTLGAMSGWMTAYGVAAVLLSLLFAFHLAWLPVCEPPGPPLPFPSPARMRRPGMGLLLLLVFIALAIVAWRQFAPAIDLPVPKASFAAWTGVALLGSLILLAAFRKPIYRRLLARPESFYAQSFFSFIDRDRIGIILAFIVLIRTGEFALSAMFSPFMVDLGLKSHYGWISAAVGLPCSIAGAMAGGWLISRFTMRKMIWPFLLLQNLTNILFMVLAAALAPALSVNTGNPTPVPLTAAEMLAVATAHGFDQFAGGLGTAVLMTYLMRICKPEYKASHYAIGTGLMNVSGLYAGALSGFLAATFGYAAFFGISFVLSVPGMLLVFWLPTGMAGEKARPRGAGAAP